MRVYKVTCWNKPIYDIHTERKEIAVYETHELADQAIDWLKKSREFKHLWEASTLAVEAIEVHNDIKALQIR